MRPFSDFLTPNTIRQLTQKNKESWSVLYPELLSGLREFNLFNVHHPQNNPFDTKNIYKLLTIITTHSRPKRSYEEGAEELNLILAHANLHEIRCSFVQTVNYLLESTYLQPFKDYNQGEKQELRNGKIERETYGAMHAVRLLIYVFLLHHFLQKNFPYYTNQTMSTLSQNLNFSEQEIIVLAALTSLLHHSHRKNERDHVYQYEEDSAYFIRMFLLNRYIPPEIIGILFRSVHFKNKSLEFFEIYSEKDSLYYLRILINISNYFDTMRYEKKFQLDDIIEILAPLFQYESTYNKKFNPELAKAEIIKLAQSLHQLIYTQKDMLFDCKIFFEGTQIPTQSTGSNYSLKHKVSFEHSLNIFNKTLFEMRKDPFLSAHLISLPPIEFIPETIPQAAFNPSIHGTNSSLLPLLKLTEFKMLPLFKMFLQYGYVPFSGEIILGGLEVIGKDSGICFGRLHVHKSFSEAYDLNRVIKDYAKKNLNGTTESQALFDYRDSLTQAFEKNFSNLNILIVHAARCRQFGISKKDMHQVIYEKTIEEQIAEEWTKRGISNLDILENLKTKVTSKKEIYPETSEEKIEEQFNLVIQFCYFILLFKEKIFPDIKKYRGLEEKIAENLRDSLYHYFTNEKILSLIKEKEIDMKAIYEGKPGACIEPVIEMLRLPTELEIKGKKIVLPETQFFSKTETMDIKKSDPEENGDEFYIVKNTRSNSIQIFMEELFQHPSSKSSSMVASWESFILQHIKQLEDSFNDFKKALNIEAISLSGKEKKYITEPFPMIIIVDDEENISLHDFNTHEFRWNSDNHHLILGKNIRLIATDTEENKAEILAYCEENSLDVNVVLFHEIENSAHLLEDRNNTATGRYTSRLFQRSNIPVLILPPPLETQDSESDSESPEALVCDFSF